MASPLRSVVNHVKRHPRKYAALALGLLMAAAFAAVMVFCPPAALVAVIPAVIATSPVLLPLVAAAAGFVGGMIVAGMAALTEIGIGKAIKKYNDYKRAKNFEKADNEADFFLDKKPSSPSALAKLGACCNFGKSEAPHASSASRGFLDPKTKRQQPERPEDLDVNSSAAPSPTGSGSL